MQTAEDIRIDTESIRRTLLCPYCNQRMSKWAVPNTPFSTWDAEFLYICFNDRCRYYVHGWKTMSEQGRQGMSYRFMFDPDRGSGFPILVTGPYTLKDGIVEE